MKTLNKLLSLLLCLVMVLGLLPNMTLAADGEPNIYMATSTDEVDVGDTLTVTIGYMDMNVSSFAFGLYFDKDLLEVTKISVSTLDYYDEENDEDTVATATAKSTKTEANESGLVGVAFARAYDTECYGKEDILTVTFKAIAAGTVDFAMFEDSAGTDGYKVDVIEGESLTINEAEAVVPGTGYTWTKVELGDITATDTIAITMTYTDGTTWALYNANGTSSAPTAVVVTVSGEVMTSEDKDTLAWNIANDNGTLTIYVAGGTDAWLYSTNSNNGTRVGTNSNKTWVVDSASGYLQHVGTSRYLGVYRDNPDWRSYKNTTGNTKDQTLSFWKLTESGGEGGETPTECTHENATHFAANSSTCQAKGNIEYWYCADCDKYFSDAAYTTEIAKADTELPLGDHAYTEIREGTWKCDVCGHYKADSILTIAEAIELGATFGKDKYTTDKYYVIGKITEVYNTEYGNMYITDDEGNVLTVYGTYNEDGSARYDAMTEKPIAGDIVKLYGVIGKYNDPQMKNGWIIEWETPECEHPNKEFRAATPSTCSVAGTIDHWYCPDCDRNFADEACTEVLTDISAPLDEHDYNNPEDARRCVNCGYYKPDSTLTIPEANEFGNDFFDHNTFSEGKYFVTGTVVEIKSTSYGNVYIEDAEGNRFYIYGIVDENGTKFDQAGIELGVGDVITVYGIIGNYNGAQMKSAVITQRTPAHVCGEGTLTETEQEDADCGHAGHKAYWTCSCGKVYADATATTEIADLAAWLADGGEGYIPATGNHNYIPGEYVWSEDYSTCTVVGTCGCGAAATATAESTYEYTYGNCQTAESATFTADFEEAWAVDQVKTVTGEKNFDNHVGELTGEYVDYFEHKVYYSCCPDAYVLENHFEGEDGCPCGAIGVRVYFRDAYFEGVDPSWGEDSYYFTFYVMKDQDLRVKIFAGGEWPYVSYDIWDNALDDPWPTSESAIKATELVVSHEWYDAGELWIEVNAHSMQFIDLNGGSLTDEAKESWGDWYDAEKNIINKPSPAGGSWTLSWYTEEIVREGFVLSGFMDGNTFCALDSWIESTPEDRTLTLVWKCEDDHADTSCTVDEDGTHTIACDSCGEVIETFEGHQYDDVNHKCVCGDVEKFTLIVDYLVMNETTGLAEWKSTDFEVPYGAKIMDAIQAEIDDLLPDGTVLRYKSEDLNGEITLAGFHRVDEDTTMPAGGFFAEQSFYSVGWNYYGEYTAFIGPHGPLDGWQYIEEDYDDVAGGAWYYFAKVEDFGLSVIVKGLTRVEYPTVTINGITYGPNQDALDYCEQEGTTFIDATEAWFLFDENGKFMNTVTGVQNGHYYANGMQTWHPGAVAGMYFIGDVVNGGNIPANGDTYIIYANDSELVEGAIYHFVDGVLSGREGIVDGKYYEGSRLMIGNGLTKIGENYIYVRSNGYIVVNAEYYVGENDLGIATGMYYFDENGFLVEPVTSDKNGVYFENDAYYYYQDGKIVYGQGLIQISAYWHESEGDFYVENATIYVRSNGQLATGYYYVTNLANYTGTDVKVGDKVLFGFDAIMLETRNGIVGNRYYVNNHIAYGAGLVEYNGGYIYVRSDGTVVKGTSYWITNTNGLLDQGCYEFDEDGMIVIPETYGQTGIIDGYYYVDGKIAYGMGLLEIEEGVYIYVRSNGQLATGEYYITNLSNYEGTAFKVGDKLIFGENGKLTVN